MVRINFKRYFLMVRMVRTVRMNLKRLKNKK